MKACHIFGAANGFPESFKIEKSDLVIVADAGLKAAERLNITPDIILGDFDSLGFEPLGNKVEIFPVKKDDTDTLLAVKRGFAEGCDSFFLYGCSGGRIDHFLANLQTLSFITSRGGKAILYGEGFCAATLTNKKLCLKARAEGKISVFSLTTVCNGVSIKGLLYETEDAVISYDFPLGVSNEFVGKSAEISVKEGTLLVICEGELMTTE